MRKALCLVMFVFVCMVFFYTTVQAENIVYTFDDLNEELNKSETADVVLDGMDIDNVDGWLTIKKGQIVDVENIKSWTNTNSEYIISGDKYIAGTNPYDNKRQRLIMNNGSLALRNVSIKNNDLLLASGSAQGGAIIQNRGNISVLSNIEFDNNMVNTLKKNDLWGGLIANTHGGSIGQIIDSKFSNNSFLTQQSAPHGAVIYNGSNKTSTIDLIDNVVFENNVMQASINQKGGGHGTAIDNNQYGIINKITNSKFVNNRTYKPGDSSPLGEQNHASGGAIDNYNIIKEISNTLFIGNNAEIESANRNGRMYARAGAIVVTNANASGSEGRVDKIDNVQFIENYAKNINGEALGGAIATSGDTVIGEIINTKFVDNYVQGDGRKDGSGGALGGAIYNLKGDINKISGVFDSNKALSLNAKAQGGAIWNTGFVGIKDTNFDGNYVSGKLDVTDGGAIWNKGALEFEGKNYFVGNYKLVNGTKYNNDIYNEGSINLKDGALVDITGGITGSSGIINLGEGASLNINNTEVSGNKIVMADKASIILEINNLNDINSEQSGGVIDGDIILNGVNTLEFNTTTINWSNIDRTADYQFADNVDATSGNWVVNVSKNGIYDINTDLEANNKVVFDAKIKNSEEIAENLSLSNEKTNQLIEIVKTKSDNELFEKIREEFSLGGQNMDKNLGGALDSFNDKPGITVEVLRNQGVTIAKTISDRMFVYKNSDAQALADDEYSSKKNVWVSTIHQTAEDKGNLNFNLDSNAFVAGFDKNINPNLIAGFGYSYVNSDVDAYFRNMKFDTHHLFLYGEYFEDDLFFNLFGVYGFSDVSQDKYVLGNKISGSFDSDVFGLHLTLGRNLERKILGHNMILRPSAGIRYYYISQDKYRDNAGIEYGRVKNNITTGVVGVEIQNEMMIKNINVKQRGYVNATYDFSNDGDNMYTKLPNLGGYGISHKEGGAFGVEVGCSAEAEVSEGIKTGINYELGVKDKYTSHSGVVNLRCEF